MTCARPWLSYERIWSHTARYRAVAVQCSAVQCCAVQCSAVHGRGFHMSGFGFGAGVTTGQPDIIS